jgi:hypothetical protein
VETKSRDHASKADTFFGQRPSHFYIIFLSTTLLTGMTGISFHLQWSLTSQSLVFHYGSNSTPGMILKRYKVKTLEGISQLKPFSSRKCKPDASFTTQPFFPVWWFTSKMSHGHQGLKPI